MEKILVVDDERSMRDVLSIMLKRAGYDVSLASDGSEAIAQVGKDIFDLVITDLKMPKVGRVGSVEGGQGDLSDTVVLLITAFASSDSAVEAMKLGAYDYLSKPFQVDEVQLIVRNALEKRRLFDRKHPFKTGDRQPIIVGHIMATANPCRRSSTWC